MAKRRPGGYKPVNFADYRELTVKHNSTVDQKNLANAGSVVNAFCSLDYLDDKLIINLQSHHLLFKACSIKVFFQKQPITCLSFNNTPSRTFTTEVSLRNTPIDFFGFSTDRIFTIIFSFSALNVLSLVSTFTATLPVIKTNEMDFKPPGITYPDVGMRRICQQGFKLDYSNSDEEINRCITIEEFKLVAIEERYKVYGYVPMLKEFINIENSFELDLVQKFNLNNASVLRVNATHFRIDTAGQIPTAAASVCLTPMDAMNAHLDAKELTNLQICGSIINYHRNYITFQLNRKGKTINKDDRFHVEFRPNFYVNAMAQRTLRHIAKNGFEDFFKDFTLKSLTVQTKNMSEIFDDFEWFNTSVGKNYAQSTAIKHIVNRSSFPSPFIVFGPPGTGKTSTLVEAVAQIVKLRPYAKILLTVNSNSACDEIGERLLKFVSANKMFRYYSPSFAKKLDRIHPKVKPCSNVKYGYHINPTIQEIMSYNVVIATLVNSGRLRSIGKEHFDFIFIDECASSAEAYVAIPIILGMKKNIPFKTSIVLLGDPKQLGQIMRTFHSERFGFSISLMERVMTMEYYRYPYNPRYIVQLTDNFRSHQAILAFSNKEFYNSILQAKQVETIANFAVGWNLLPNPEIPILFHASWVPSEQEGTSLFNCGEISIVKKYVGNMLRDGINGKRVTMKDIGIISPYASQREKLRQVYPSGVEIGTVEYFQGREKLIVIVTSVRSKTPTVGFLKNEKRLNVALTRAKALLIVIGNPETLGKNHFWRKFIQLCCRNKASVGKVPNWVLQKGATPPESEEDDDEAVRFEEMINGFDVEE